MKSVLYVPDYLILRKVVDNYHYCTKNVSKINNIQMELLYEKNYSSYCSYIIFSYS